MRKKPPVGTGKAFIPPLDTDFRTMFEPQPGKKNPETNRKFTAKEREVYLTGGIKPDNEPAEPLCPDLFNDTAVGRTDIPNDGIPVLSVDTDSIPTLVKTDSDIPISSIIDENPFNQTDFKAPPPVWKR